jgi:hypothetical protein
MTSILFCSIFSLSGYASLNTSQTAAHYFDAKQCSKLNTLSARKYTLLAIAERLRKWCQYQPSNQCNIESTVTGKVGESIIQKNRFRFHFHNHSTWWLFWLGFKWITLYKSLQVMSGRMISVYHLSLCGLENISVHILFRCNGLPQFILKSLHFTQVHSGQRTRHWPYLLIKNIYYLGHVSVPCENIHLINLKPYII